MKALYLILSLFFLLGCGGRAHLTEDMGRSSAEIWRAQRMKRQASEMSLLSADEAKKIWGFCSKCDSGDAGGMMGGTAGGGSINPSSGDLGGGNGNRNIQINAK